MNEEKIQNLKDFLLDFQDDFSNGEPYTEKFEDEQIVLLVYKCKKGCANTMYRSILNSTFFERLKVSKAGKLLNLTHSTCSVLVEVQINND